MISSGTEKNMTSPVGFIKSTDLPPTNQIIIFKILGNRKISMFQNTHAAEKIILFYYLFDK